MKYKIKLKHVMLCCYYLLFNLLQGATINLQHCAVFNTSPQSFRKKFLIHLINNFRDFIKFGLVS